MRDEKIRVHPLKVERYDTISSATNCQILFISASERPKIDKIIAEVRNLPLLTVSDAGYTENGGMVDFYIDAENKVRLRINPETAKTAGLTVSSRLLRVAQVVGAGK